MAKSKQMGMFLMIAASIEALFMLVGAMRRSYLAIALPVMAAVGLISALAFWVGWTMMNVEPELMELEAQDAVPAVA